jgi:hypothetical protein
VPPVVGVQTKPSGQSLSSPQAESRGRRRRVGSHATVALTFLPLGAGVGLLRGLVVMGEGSEEGSGLGLGERARREG